MKRRFIMGVAASVAVVAFAGFALFHPFAKLSLGVETIAPDPLAKELSTGANPFIVDVRSEAEYAAGHIPTSVNIPYASLNEVNADIFPPNTKIVVVCRHGNQSLLAAASLQKRGIAPTFSLEGGTAAWRQGGFLEETGALDPSAGRLSALGVRSISVFEQVVSVLSGLVLKPIYMFMTLLIWFWMRRAVGLDFRLIRAGLLMFLVGEGFCAADFLITGGKGYELDILHGLGMVAMGALLSYGVVEFFDSRMLHFSTAKGRCAARRFCRECIKEQKTRCILKDLFVFAALSLAALSLLPLSLPLQLRYEVARVFDSDVIFSYPLEGQLIDFRLLPLLAGLLFVAASGIMAFSKENAVARAKLPFFFAVGLLGFSLFRFFLSEAFRFRPVWADFWEELTEFLAILGVGVFYFFVRSKVVPDTSRQ